MRRFVNPGNTAFEVAVNSQIYVDKTGLLAYTNSVINTKQALICSSRPRRFGKSITADMLCAYYSRGCDSDSIFASIFRLNGRLRENIIFLSSFILAINLSLSGIPF